jgi:hypothetical protein
MTTREGKQGIRSHRYLLANGFEAVRMADGEWMIWKDGREFSKDGYNVYHRTLRDCRAWAKLQVVP